MSTNGATPRTRRDLILSQVGVLAEEEATMPGPDGPVPVLIRELTGTEARAFEKAVKNGGDAPLGYMLSMSLRDPDTKELIFEPADRSTIEALGISILKPLILTATKLSGLSDEDIEKAKASLMSGPPTG